MVFRINHRRSFFFIYKLVLKPESYLILIWLTPKAAIKIRLYFESSKGGSLVL